MKKTALLVLSLFLLIAAQAQPVDKKMMTKEVKNAFLHCWNGYKQYAWGYDALKPISKQGHNWYKESLLMTPLDAYDVMMIMGLKKVAKEARQLIFDRLHFDVDMDVQNFEVSIRILGGLLSAYELDGNKRFLDLAKDLADRLIVVFNSPTGMPYRYVNLKTGKTSGPVSNPAEIGTYILEYGILSHHSGDPKYYETAKKAMMKLHSLRSPIGLPGVGINVETGEWTNTESSISGGVDSYFEYMLKAAILFNDKDMREMWQASLAAINRYMSDTTQSGFWYGRVNMNTGERTRPIYGSLDAFFAGSLALDGDLKRAALLQKSNYNMWMLHGIEPEVLDYSKMEVPYPNYELRPENIESAYYLYHFTCDEKYLRMGKEMFDTLEKYCRSEVGFTALKSVVTKERTNDMESFFLAETLKYFYLLFDDGRSFDFDKVIFNTEAHPYKRF